MNIPLRQTIFDVLEILKTYNCISVIFRICLAILLGSCIGSERKRHGQAAGARTHALVCLGSALTVIVGLYSVNCLGSTGDPLRVSAQVISGIGFLCAGTIFTRNQNQITGLTTAAGIWTTSTIGLLIGIGFYEAALVGFIGLEIVVALFNFKTRRIHNSHPDTYYLELSGPEYVNEFSDRFQSHDICLQVIKSKSGINSHVGILLVLNFPRAPEDFLKELRALDYVVIAIPQLL